MTKEQIIFLRNTIFADDGTGKTLASKSVIGLDNEHAMRPDVSVVVWNDDLELVHNVRSNNEFTTQSIAPIEISTSAYEMIQVIDSAYTLKNFETAIDKLGFPEEIKEVAMKFAKECAKSQARREVRPTPYFKTEPTVIPYGKENMDIDTGYTRKDITRIKSTSSEETNPKPNNSEGN